MPRHLLTALLAATSLLAVATASAAATPLSAMSDLYTLVAETSMVSADQEPDKHAAKAIELLKTLDGSLPGVLTAVAGQDSERAGELKAQWQDLKSAYAGTPALVYFRENTYDTNMSARYTAGASALLIALDPQATTEAAKSLPQQVSLQVLKTVVSYIQVSTGLVGGTSFSANDKDNDIPAGVAAVDKGLIELKQKYAGKPEAATVQSAAVRWQFLRPTLLKSGGQATPFIVYTHGLSVAQTLNKLEAAH